MIWLASSSPRRAELLTQLGVSFERLLPDDPIAAEALEAERMGEPPNQYVLRVTLAKLALAQQKIAGKGLADRPVLTAVAVARGQRVRHCVQISRVRFARLREADILAYAASGEGLDKAGGYGIQGNAARFVRSINGSYSGIMGLPLYETSRLLGL